MVFWQWRIDELSGLFSKVGKVRQVLEEDAFVQPLFVVAANFFVQDAYREWKTTLVTY